MSRLSWSVSGWAHQSTDQSIKRTGEPDRLDHQHQQCVMSTLSQLTSNYLHSHYDTNQLAVNRSANEMYNRSLIDQPFTDQLAEPICKWLSWWGNSRSVKSAQPFKAKFRISWTQWIQHSPLNYSTQSHTNCYTVNTQTTTNNQQ